MIPGERELGAKTRQKRCNFISFLRGHRFFYRHRHLAGFAELGPDQGRQAIQVFCGDIFHSAFGEFSFEAVQLLFESDQFLLAGGEYLFLQRLPLDVVLLVVRMGSLFARAATYRTLP